MTFNTYGVQPVSHDPYRIPSVMRDVGGLVKWEFHNRGVNFTLRNGVTFYVDQKMLYGDYHTLLAYMRSGVAECLK